MPDPLPISVAVVDDHPVVRDGITMRLLTADDIVVAWEADTGEEALASLTDSPPDVVVLDIALPKLSGIEVAQWIRQHHPAVGVVLITGYPHQDYSPRLAELGASTCLPKTVRVQEFIDAIRTAARQAHKGGKDAVDATAGQGSPPTLTEREIEVLQLLIRGSSNAEIARRLTVSVKTVEFHVGHILRKVGARSRLEAVAKARDLRKIV